MRSTASSFARVGPPVGGALRPEVTDPLPALGKGLVDVRSDGAETPISICVLVRRAAGGAMQEPRRSVESLEQDAAPDVERNRKPGEIEDRREYVEDAGPPIARAQVGARRPCRDSGSGD